MACSRMWTGKAPVLLVRVYLDGPPDFPDTDLQGIDGDDFPQAPGQESIRTTNDPVRVYLREIGAVPLLTSGPCHGLHALFRRAGFLRYYGPGVAGVQYDPLQNLRRALELEKRQRPVNACLHTRLNTRRTIKMSRSN